MHNEIKPEKTMHAQNEKINDEIETIKNQRETVEPKNYNNWTKKKFTRGLQQQTWSGRKISKLEDRSQEITQRSKRMAKWREPKECTGH